MHNRTGERGMTLVETMTVIGIMSIIMVVVSQIFVVNNELVAKSLARADNDNGATFAIRRIGELSRGASTVMASHIINGTTYTSGTNVLVLVMPSVDSSGNIIVASYDYIAFYRDAVATTKIFTDTDAAVGSVRVDGSKLLTAYNDTLAFSYNARDISEATRISVFVINTQTVRGQVLSTKAWTSIFLRNN